MTGSVVGSSRTQTPGGKEAASSKPQLEADGGSGLSWRDVDVDGFVLREKPNGDGLHADDQEERLAFFGGNIGASFKQLPDVAGNNRSKDQLVGAAKSVGAGHREAAESMLIFAGRHRE